jgi:hypothetical protein
MVVETKDSQIGQLVLSWGKTSKAVAGSGGEYLKLICEFREVLG